MFWLELFDEPLQLGFRVALPLSPVGLCILCQLPRCDQHVAVLMDQHKDEATIPGSRDLWNMARAKGDTNFERCLFTSDIMEILPSGKLKTATDQLGFTAKNK